MDNVRDSVIDFEGNWTEEEKNLIFEIIKETDEPYFDARYYNFWRFSRLSSGFIIGSRVTWETRIYGNNLDELISKLKKYYGR